MAAHSEQWLVNDQLDGIASANGVGRRPYPAWRPLWCCRHV